MKQSTKTIGTLLITGGIALIIPYSILSVIFEYPLILRQETGVILNKFYAGGGALVAVWFAFAVTGIPLIPAFIMTGQQFEQKVPMLRTATTIGVIGLIVQMIGLLRWAFVVPVIAQSYVHATDEATRAAAILSFKTIHQFGGVLLGEHLGQLCTVAWTIMICIAFAKLKMLPKWVTIFGILSAVIYFLAQAQLFATVIPGFPVWDMAGAVGSTLWLIWLITTGFFLFRKKNIA